MVIITENTTVTPAATDTSERDARFLRLAAIQYKNFVDMVTKEIERQRREGNLNESEARDLLRNANLPQIDNGRWELEVPISYTVKVRKDRRDHDTAESVLDYLKRNASLYIRNTVLTEVTVGDDVKGLPGTESVETYTEPKTAEEMMERIDTATKSLLDWVAGQIFDGHHWCLSGVNDSLVRAGLPELPRAENYKVTRPSASGETSITVAAFSAEQAVKLAEKHIAQSGVYIPADKIQWTDGSTFTATVA